MSEPKPEVTDAQQLFRETLKKARRRLKAKTRTSATGLTFVTEDGETHHIPWHGLLRAFTVDQGKTAIFSFGGAGTLRVTWGEEPEEKRIVRLAAKESGEEIDRDYIWPETLRNLVAEVQGWGVALIAAGTTPGVGLVRLALPEAGEEEPTAEALLRAAAQAETSLRVALVAAAPPQADDDLPPLHEEDHFPGLPDDFQ